MGTTSQTGLGWIGKLSDGWTAKLELYHGMSGVEGGGECSQGLTLKLDADKPHGW